MNFEGTYVAMVTPLMMVTLTKKDLDPILII